jgi:thiol-disulfide isomerase/thioredoxin
MSQHAFLRALPALFVAMQLGSALPAQSQTLTEEQITKLRALYQQASTSYMKKEYEKSNDIYAEVLKILPSVKEGSVDKTQATIHYNMGCNFTLLGKKKDALHSLSRAVNCGFWNHDYMKKDPSLKDLQGEKDFAALVEKAKKAVFDLPFKSTDILTGKAIERKDYEGKVVIFDVWGTWCPPCREEIPSFVKLQKKFADKGLKIIGLTYERGLSEAAALSRVKGFASQNGMNYAVALVGSDVVTALDVSSFPTTIFIGKDGTVADRILGLHPYEDLEARVMKLIEAK